MCYISANSISRKLTLNPIARCLKHGIRLSKLLDKHNCLTFNHGIEKNEKNIAAVLNVKINYCRVIIVRIKKLVTDEMHEYVRVVARSFSMKIMNS